MYKDRHMEGAFQELMSESLPKFESDDDMYSYLLGLQRQYSLSNSEIIEVAIASSLALIKRGQEKTTQQIDDMNVSPLYKTALKAGVEAQLLPTKIKAHIKNITK